MKGSVTAIAVAATGGCVGVQASANLPVDHAAVVEHGVGGMHDLLPEGMLRRHRLVHLDAEPRRLGDRISALTTVVRTTVIFMRAPGR